MTNTNQKIIDIFANNISKEYGAEPRLLQVQAALDVSSYIEGCKAAGYAKRNKLLFLEAPVGTGKSLAGLIPCLVAVNEASRKKYNGIVYATATLGLQSQLWENEIPLCKQLGLLNKNDEILAMGRDNYACLKTYRKNKSRFSSYERVILDDFFKSGQTGLKTELQKRFSHSILNEKWNLIKIDGNEFDCDCVGHRYRSMIASHHKLTLTNHRQFIAAVKNKNDAQGKTNLFSVENKVIIIDEAHEFQQNLLESLVSNIRFEEIDLVVKKYLNLNGEKQWIELKNRLCSRNENVYSKRGKDVLRQEDIEQ